MLPCWQPAQEENTRFISLRFNLITGDIFRSSNLQQSDNVIDTVRSTPYLAHQEKFGILLFGAI